MRYEFGSARAVCSLEERSEPQNLRVSIIVLKAPKAAGAKGDIPKIYGFVHSLANILLEAMCEEISQDQILHTDDTFTTFYMDQTAGTLEFSKLRLKV